MGDDNVASSLLAPTFTQPIALARTGSGLGKVSPRVSSSPCLTRVDPNRRVLPSLPIVAGVRFLTDIAPAIQCAHHRLHAGHTATETALLMMMTLVDQKSVCRCRYLEHASCKFVAYLYTA
eukprot:6196975-Pleurochrysis_carterae.AAC.3